MAGHVPITNALLDLIDQRREMLKSLEKEEVKPFLQSYLRWRVVTVSNQNEAKECSLTI